MFPPGFNLRSNRRSRITWVSRQRSVPRFEVASQNRYGGRRCISCLELAVWLFLGIFGASPNATNAQSAFANLQDRIGGEFPLVMRAASVVVYSSVDETIARPILDRFQKDSGIQIQSVFDSEAGKTTGLLQRIMIEARAGRTRADVLWSGEIFGTIALARDEFLDAYDSPSAKDIPSTFRDVHHRWTGYALRGRVIAYDPKKTNEANLPKSWAELANPDFASHLALANPLFGTTRGHVAAMFVDGGPDGGMDWLRRVHEAGAMIVDGNSAAVRALMDGRVSLAATDTDDVLLAKRTGRSIAMTFPLMKDGGALLIPCTVALVRGAPNSSGARRLIDFLISGEVETDLANSPAGHYPVRPSLQERLGIKPPRATALSFVEIAEMLDPASKSVREILLR